jgi:DNA-directed RNA polymerase specialized sigma24 family protein
MDDFLSIIKGYQDLQKEIDMHQALLDTANRNIKYYAKQMTAGAPRDISAMAQDGQPRGGFSPISLDRAFDEVQKWEHAAYLEKCEIEYLENKKKEIEESIKQLKGLEQKVAFKRIIEGKTLQEMADELHHSFSTIAHVSAGIAQKLKYKSGRT